MKYSLITTTNYVLNLLFLEFNLVTPIVSTLVEKIFDIQESREIVYLWARRNNFVVKHGNVYKTEQDWNLHWYRKSFDEFLRSRMIYMSLYHYDERMYRIECRTQDNEQYEWEFLSYPKHFLSSVSIEKGTVNEATDDWEIIEISKYQFWHELFEILNKFYEFYVVFLKGVL